MEGNITTFNFESILIRMEYKLDFPVLIRLSKTVSPNA